MTLPYGLQYLAFGVSSPDAETNFPNGSQHLAFECSVDTPLDFGTVPNGLQVSHSGSGKLQPAAGHGFPERLTASCNQGQAQPDAEQGDPPPNGVCPNQLLGMVIFPNGLQQHAFGNRFTSR